MSLDYRIEERLEEAKKRVEIAQLQMQAEADIRHRDRRERIATACMAALLTKYGVGPEDEKHSAYAVAFADALSAELDKPKEVKP